VSLGLAYPTAARVANAEGRQPDGEQRTNQALAVYEKLAIDPAVSPAVGESLLQLAKVQELKGSRTEATATARRAAAALSAGYGSEHATTQDARRMAGASS
jgi:hypothetical protein